MAEVQESFFVLVILIQHLVEQKGFLSSPQQLDKNQAHRQP